jgi:hypothetical protein
MERNMFGMATATLIGSLLLGYATAQAGDFNHDGFDDLAIGVRGETVGNVRSGAVAVLYGTTAGITATSPADQFFSQDTAGVPGASQDGDNFGFALATGDFNRDGFDDLAIGIPNRDVSGLSDAGAVAIIFGSSTGLSTTHIAPQLFTEATAVFSALFGSSLAADDFDGDGFCDLAIGAPSERIGLASGAGVVNVLYGTSAGLSTARRQVFHQGSGGIGDTPEQNDAFGASLAASDFNGDHLADLAIGAPRENVGTATDCGMVHVLFGFPNGLSGVGSLTLQQGVNGMPGSRQSGDQFGFALAAVPRARSGLAIGCPFDSDSPSRSGSVTVLPPNGLSIANAAFISQQFVSGSGPPTSQDSFGSALAMGDFGKLVFPNPFFDLAIGAPGATPVVGSGNPVTHAGTVFVVYGTSSSTFDLAHPQVLVQGQNGLLDGAEPEDRFGQALAAGNFGKDVEQDLVIGVPREDSGLVDSGIVHVIYGSVSAGLTSSGNQVWSQDSANVDELSESGDLFGCSVTGR